MYFALVDLKTVEVVEDSDETSFFVPVECLDSFLPQVEGCGASVIKNEAIIFGQDSKKALPHPRIHYVSFSHLSSSEAANLADTYNSSLR